MKDKIWKAQFLWSVLNFVLSDTCQKEVKLFSYITVCGLIIKLVQPVKYTILKGENLLPFSESQPYQELDGVEPISSGMGALQLDDDNEFPPMTHKLDP